jgi:hypothetical protein
MAVVMCIGLIVATVTGAMAALFEHERCLAKSTFPRIEAKMLQDQLLEDPILFYSPRLQCVTLRACCL